MSEQKAQAFADRMGAARATMAAHKEALKVARIAIVGDLIGSPQSASPSPSPVKSGKGKGWSKGRDNTGKVQQPSPGDGVGGDEVVPVAGGEADTAAAGEVASSSRDIASELEAVADCGDVDKQFDQS